MRTTVSFLIGCVFGATGILIWVSETRAMPRGEAEVTAASVTAPGATPNLPPSVVPAGFPVLQMPVEGIRPSDLRRDFDDKRGGGRVHQALDILAPKGTPVLAVADGKIRKLFTSKAGGLTIYQYDEAEKTCFYYAHLDRYAEGIREGMSVKSGSLIGYVGTTGNAPPGAPHLHFAVTRLPPTKEWWKGEAVDPFPLLTAR
jgi:murein DD-endopeptidase MepM/ murein hydrolase activator NlpD